MEQKQKVVIQANQRSSFFNFKEFWRYRDLLYFMVLRDITVLYKQTILGFAWAIINPLFQIVIFSVIFGGLVGVKTAAGNMPYPVFSALAVIPWTYFSNSLSASGTSLITANHILSKVYFPRIIFPLVPTLSKLVDFTISFLILMGVMVYFKYYPGINVSFLLIPLLLIIITSSGLGWFSALSVQYRDFKFALSFMLPLLMYAAPVVFPAIKIQQKLGNTYYHLYALYPMVGGIEGFRTCFSKNTAMPWDLISISACSAFIIFISGLWYFKKMEKYFADIA